MQKYYYYIFFFYRFQKLLCWKLNFTVIEGKFKKSILFLLTKERDFHFWIIIFGDI